MHRSAAITVSAIVVIFGSTLTLLGSLIVLLGSILVPTPKAANNGPLAFILIIAAVMIFGFGAWGLAAGIGLLNLRQWARISVLIYAAILVFFSLPNVALMLFIPFPGTNDPNPPTNFMAFMAILRVGMALFYAMLAALAIFWLYFFNKQSVKAQFSSGQSVVGLDGPRTALEPPATPHCANQRLRPLSITVIGWFLLVGSALAPLGLLFNKALFSGVQFPLYFLGFFLLGRSAYSIVAVWMTVQAVAAVGLLKLKKWGLFATIGLQCLTLLNALLLLVIPANRERFQQIMVTMVNSMNERMPYPAHQVPFVFPMWLGFAISIPMIFVVLWFLVTRRTAFHSETQELVR
jgi:hypothetical protein